MEIKYTAKTVYLFHMTLIVIDSIRIQFILFLYIQQSRSAVVFIKSIQKFIFLCVLLRLVQSKVVWRIWDSDQVMIELMNRNPDLE